MDPPELISPSKDALFLDLPHDKRWEPLRPVIVSLRTGAHSLGDIWTIPKIAKFMKQHYNFDASPDAYSYRFRQWKVSKRVTKAEKESAIGALSRRSHVESSTGRVILKQGEASKTVDSKAIRRYLHQQKPKIDRIPLRPGVFSSWTRPYAAFVASIPRRPDMPSPFGTTAQTPENLTINSPEASSPGAARQDPSPTMHLVRQRELQQRTSLLLQGRPLELLRGCNIDDRSSIVNQLHDLHVQGIVMAKYWGKGPRTWSTGMVAALTMGNISDIAASAAGAFGSPQEHRSSQGRRSKDPGSEFPVPTNLCRWSIHVQETGYDPLPESDAERLHGQAEFFDMEHPEAWPDWSSSTQDRSFQDAVGESILATPFTPGPSAGPLLSQTLLSTALGEDADSLTIDSIRLAIMAGNVNLLGDLLEDLSESTNGDLTKMAETIYPFHLAASYLDGGSRCCGVFEVLDNYIAARGLDRDGSGHTVLDQLFLSIIRSHTTVRPDQVFTHAEGPSTFPAEEKDICGRWDADTPQVRALFTAGYTRIPTAWKHPFCHTAVQAICHACIMIFAAPYSPSIDDTSGLFARNCFWCGEKLALGPLHLTIVVAFYLAEKGMAGETLFGILTVAICLLSLGADSRQAVDICVEDFLGGLQHDAAACRHTKFDPIALMRAVPSSVVDQWTSECQTGWFCLHAVLQLHAGDRQNSIKTGPASVEIDAIASSSGLGFLYSNPLSESEETSQDGVMLESEDASSDNSSDCDLRDYVHRPGFLGIDVHNEWLNIPCTSSKFGLIWACVQTELLTYRRLAPGDDWVSSNFSMDGLLAWLRGESQSFQTPLVNGKMMKSHTRCGWFYPVSADNFIIPTAEDVSREYSMNMEDFRRSFFLPSPGLLESWLNSD